MSTPSRRRPRMPSCASVLLVLVVVAAGVWVAAHAVAVAVVRNPGGVVVPVIVGVALVGVHRWTKRIGSGESDRMIGPTPWRTLYKPTDRTRETASTHPCALAHWGTYCTPRHYAAPNLMVWDHCHQHGYIRGPLCAYHNGRMRLYDEGHERYVDDPDLIDYARRCAGCAPPW